MVESTIFTGTGSNKRSVPINRTVSSNWNQRVPNLHLKIQNIKASCKEPTLKEPCCNEKLVRFYENSTQPLKARVKQESPPKPLKTAFFNAKEFLENGLKTLHLTDYGREHI